ncbi:MAG: hypothetical protein KC493_17175 [Bacteriovoracaceae bacterium]|nr:hypothetical protein [Bacteriovoracaceae bacterium]
MNKPFKLIGLSTMTLFLSTTVFAETDYSKCSQFINPFQGESSGFGYQGGSSGSGGVGLGVSGGGFGTGGLYPFKLKKNGKIEPAKGVKSYEFNKDSNEEIIEFEIPTFPYLMEPGQEVDFSKIKPVMKVQRVIIKRDKDNEIKTITNDFDVKQKDLDNHNKMMKKWFEYTYSDKYKEQMKKMQAQWGLEDFQTPIMMPLKSDLHLSQVNGKCRVDRHTITNLMDNKIDGFKYDTVSYDTKLCKDLGDALAKHQKTLEKCFSQKAAKDFSKIASDFYESNHRESPGNNFGFGQVGSGYPGGGIGGGFGIGMGTFPGMGGGMGFGMGMGGYGMGMQSLENQVAGMANNSQFSGIPPAVAANNLYNTCRWMGLGEFENDEYWPKEPALSAPPHGDDGASGEGTEQ